MDFGILTGFGDRAREVREENYKKNQSLLSNASNIWTHIASSPDISDEGRKHAIGMLLLAGTSDPSGKIPKQLTDLSPLQSGIQPGKSDSFGGGPEGGPPTYKAQYPSSPSQRLSLPSNAGNAPSVPVELPSYPYHGPDRRMSLPSHAGNIPLVPSSIEIPAPQPPTQPYFKSSQQRRDEERMTTRNRYRDEYEARRDFAIPEEKPAPEIRPFGPEQGLYDPSKGTVIREPQIKPPSPDTSVSMPELFERAAKGDEIAIEALRLAKEQNEGRSAGTLFERLGPEGYYDHLKKSAEARAGGGDETINAYIKGITEGNITNMSQVPQALRGSVLASMGDAFVITPTDREAIRKLDLAGNMLDSLETYSKKVNADPTDVESMFVLNGLRQATGGVFAKGLFAEVGVLTDADIKRVQSLIPGVVRSVFVPGVSEKQFAEMRQIISRAKQNYRRTIGRTNRDDGSGREVVEYQGRRYYLVGTDAQGNAILEPVEAAK